MKRILLFFILLGLQKALHAQQPYIYTIKADSVKITNTCDTAELIIENHTQNVPGFLFNKGRGRTEFRRINQFNDTSVVIGGDTIHLGRGSKNFANANLTFDNDHFHNGAFHNVSLSDFSQIDLMSNNTDYTASSELKMNPSEGYNLNVTDNTSSDPEQQYSVSNTMGMGISNLTVSGRKNGMFTGSNMTMESYQWGIFTDGTNFSTGENYSGSIAYTVKNGDNNGLRLTCTNGPIRIDTRNDSMTTDRYIDMRLNNADSITFATVTHTSDITRFSQTRTGFVFTRNNGINDFRVKGLPTSTSSTDSMLVIDNNGQVKKRPQPSARKSATVTASSYTVPSDVDVVFVNYTGGTATITLPSGTLDREITIKNLHTTNTVALSGLDSSESNTIATRGAITVKYTGSAWVGISKY